MGRIRIDGYKCERCGYEWAPRYKDREPVVCPGCKSPYWNRPRVHNGSRENLKRRDDLKSVT